MHQGSQRLLQRNVVTKQHWRAVLVAIAVFAAVLVAPPHDVASAQTSSGGAWLRLGTGEVVDENHFYPGASGSANATGAMVSTVGGGTQVSAKVLWEEPPKRLEPGEPVVLDARIEPGTSSRISTTSPGFQALATVGNSSVTTGGASSDGSLSHGLQAECGGSGGDPCTWTGSGFSEATIELPAGTVDGETRTFRWRMQNWGNAFAYEWTYMWNPNALPTGCDVPNKDLKDPPPTPTTSGIHVIGCYVFLNSPAGGVLDFKKTDLPGWVASSLATVGATVVLQGNGGDLIASGDHRVTMGGVRVATVDSSTLRGGTVLTGTPRILVNGRPAAAVGEWVSTSVTALLQFGAFGGVIRNLGDGEFADPCLRFFDNFGCRDIPLTQSIPAGTTVVEDNGSDIDVFDWLIFGPEGDNPELAQVEAKGSLILTAPLAFSHAAGESVMRLPDALQILANSAFCDGQVVTINMVTNGGIGQGTAAADVILGTPGNDVIEALEGDDVVCGGEGDDTIDGGTGDDTLHGNGGDDTIQGFDGVDTIEGGDGDDKLFGAKGADIIRGGDGADTLHGNRGADQLFGGEGPDRIFGYSENDVIYGGPGDDRLHGHFGDDIMFGEDGDDRMFGYGNNDTIDTGPGNDLAGGNFGDDTIDGGPGNDTLYGSDGTDTVSGGVGNDQVAGNSGSDTVNGNAGDDTLDGGIDFDVCNGHSGIDTATRCETITGVP